MTNFKFKNPQILENKESKIYYIAEYFSDKKTIWRKTDGNLTDKEYELTLKNDVIQLKNNKGSVQYFIADYGSSTFNIFPFFRFIENTYEPYFLKYNVQKYIIVISQEAITKMGLEMIVNRVSTLVDIYFCHSIEEAMVIINERMKE